MLNLRSVLLGLVLLLVAGGLATPFALSLADDSEPAAGVALGPAFTYHGRLEEDGVPANGSYDFRFTLHSDAVANSPVGSQSEVTKAGVIVTNGAFSTSLDFGPGAFNGESRWLSVEAKQGAAEFVLLSPRQELTATPNALWAGNGPFWNVGGNAGTSSATFLGTTDNAALELRVNGSRGLRIEPGSTPNLIGGHSANAVVAGVAGASISGGGSPGVGRNQVFDNYGTIGGGTSNQAGKSDGSTTDSENATVGGGFNNIASSVNSTVSGGNSNDADGIGGTVGGGGQNHAGGLQSVVSGGNLNTAIGFWASVGGGRLNSAEFGATVAGGFENTASGDSAVVGGGFSNVASAESATVGGGEGNIASGTQATVPGGFHNTAGTLSFAAGQRAKATGQGTFVWSDSKNFDYAISGTNAFAARATGGFEFVFQINEATGALQKFCRLTAASGSWACFSDRNEKTNFTAVDGLDVLNKLDEVPILRWTSKDVVDAPPHMGPMAQDFYAAFGLGGDDRSIATIDLDGVSLAAIKGLYEITKEQQQRIAALETQLANLSIETPMSPVLSTESAPASESIELLEARLQAIEANLADGETHWRSLAAIAIGLLGVGFGLGRMRLGTSRPLI